MLGWKRNKDTWFVLSFKEHLFLGKVEGPRVAGGAAGSARRRHGRFCCAFLKERKEEEETSQPTLSLKPLRSPGWRLGKDEDVVQPVTTRRSLLPTKANRTKERRQRSLLQPCPPGVHQQEPAGKKLSPGKATSCLPLGPAASQEGQVRASLPRGLCSRKPGLSPNGYERPW